MKPIIKKEINKEFQFKNIKTSLIENENIEKIISHQNSTEKKILDLKVY